MSPTDALSFGTPNYASTYAPFDSSRFYNQDAQLYYEQMRAQGFQQIQDDSQAREAREMRGKVSLTTMVAHAARRPRPAAYSRYNQVGAMYAEDRADRIMGGIAATGGFLKTGVSMAVGAYYGPVAGYAAEKVMDGTAGYTGLKGMFGQFAEINEIRGQSSQFMGGQAGDVHTGRMSRGSAYEVASHLQHTNRLGAIMKDGESLASLKDKMATLSESRLLDGTRNVDDFIQRFQKLTGAIKKMTETFGKSFEEGAAMLSEFRAMGVDPTSAQFAIQRGMGRATQHGVDFDRAYAAGMQGSLAVQGTGMTAEAGFSMGATAEGTGRTMYERGMLDSRTVFNLGGPDNLGQSVQRAQMRFLESSSYSAALMSASGQDGTDFGALTATMTGDRTLGQNIDGVGRNVNDLGSLLSYRGRQSQLTSQLMEENPGAASAMAVSNLMSIAKDQLGLDTSTMTRDELAQLAPSIYPGMTPDEMKALMADVQASAEGAGRTAIRDADVGESRASNQIGLGPVDATTRFLRSNGVVGGIVTGGSRMEDDARAAGNAMRQGMSDWMNDAFYGQTTVRTTADAVESARNLRERHGFNAEGRVYSDTELPWKSQEQADVLKSMFEQGTLTGAVVKGSMRTDYGDVIFSEEESSQLGLGNGGVYSADQLRDSGVTYVEDMGYVRQDSLNRQFEGMRATADAFAGAREAYDPRAMNDKSRGQAMQARLMIGRAFADQSSGLDNVGMTAIESMMSRFDGDGAPQMAGIVQKSLAQSLGVSTQAEGWQTKLVDAMKTQEGQQVAGNVLSALSQDPSIGDEGVRRLEQYMQLGVSPAEAKKMADEAMDNLDGLVDDQSGSIFFGVGGAEDDATRQSADALDNMSDNKRVEFYTETAEYLDANTTAERRSELDAKALTERDPVLLALRDNIINSTDEGGKALRAQLMDEDVLRGLTAQAATLPEGDLGTGDVERTSGGVEMQEGRANREAQQATTEALQSVADILREMKGSVADLHRQIQRGAGGGGQPYGFGN